MLGRAGRGANVAWLAWSFGLWGLGFGLYAMLWPLYVEQLGGGPRAIGLLATLAGLTTALVVLPGGVAADQWDRRRLVIWGTVLAVPAPLVFAWAPRWEWLAVGIVLYFGTAFSIPATQAILQQEAAGDLARAYTTVMGAYAMGSVIGPAAGGWLAAHAGFRAVFYASAALYALSALTLGPLDLGRAKTGPAALSPADWGFVRRPRFVRWTGVAALLTAATGLASPYVVPFWRAFGGWDLGTIGLFGSVGMLAAALTTPLWGRVADRIGYARALAAGLGFAVLGWTGVWIWPRDLAVQVAMAGIRGIGAGIAGIPGVAIGRVVHMAEAGRAYGLLNWVTELAGALAPYPGALLYQFQPSAPMVVTAAVWLLAAVWVATYDPPPRRVVF
ncbi:MAG: MFS transporter [Actinomycetia bacterium]|nr:MFS transporter [Actinomycetes bacterium]